MNPSDAQVLIAQLPQKTPFLFVDGIVAIDRETAVATYRFREDADFYRGHFPDDPVTPGVILLEAMAQASICLFSIYRSTEPAKKKSPVLLSSATVDYFQKVPAGSKVIIKSHLTLHRFGKLIADVKMESEEGALICEATLTGMEERS